MGYCSEASMKFSRNSTTEKSVPSDRHRALAEKLFKSLTEKGPDNREMRRPMRLRDLCAITEADETEQVLSQLAPHIPVAKARVKRIAGKKLAIVPILRAGLGMVDGILTLIPGAKVGHIGLFRDPETLEPVKYYCKMPSDIAERERAGQRPRLRGQPVRRHAGGRCPCHTGR